MPGQGGLNVLKIRVLKRGRQEGQSQKKRCYDRSRGLKVEEETVRKGMQAALRGWKRQEINSPPRASRRKGALQTHFRLWGSDL